MTRATFERTASSQVPRCTRRCGSATLDNALDDALDALLPLLTTRDVCRFAAVNRRWRRRFFHARCYARLVLGQGVTDAVFITLVSRAAGCLTSVVLCAGSERVTDAGLHVLHAQTRLVELQVGPNRSITPHGIAVALTRRDDADGIVAYMRARTADVHAQRRSFLALATMHAAPDAARVAGAGSVVVASLESHPPHASIQQHGLSLATAVLARG
jgi:hypothetical protein